MRYQLDVNAAGPLRLFQGSSGFVRERYVERGRTPEASTPGLTLWATAYWVQSVEHCVTLDRGVLLNVWDVLCDYCPSMVFEVNQEGE